MPDLTGNILGLLEITCHKFGTERHAPVGMFTFRAGSVPFLLRISSIILYSSLLYTKVSSAKKAGEAQSTR